MSPYISSIYRSPMAISKEKKYKIQFKNFKKKTVNYLVIGEDGSLDWDAETSEAGDALVSPAVVRSDRVWLVELSPIYGLESQIDAVAAFLAMGDHVLMTTDRLRDCAIRYEHEHNLYYESYSYVPCPLQGVQANRVACTNLVSDYVNATQSANKQFDSLLLDCEATVSSTLWRSLDQIKSDSITPTCPVAQLGPELQELCEKIAQYRCVDVGLVVTALLPLLAHAVLKDSLQGLPLSLFVLGVVETGGNKSTIQRFLKQPLVDHYDNLLELHDPQPDENGIIAPPPFKNFFGSDRVSIQGIIEQLAHDNCSMISAEAVSFFEGASKEQAQHTASVLSSMFSAEDTDTVLAKTRISVPARRVLNIGFLAQPIVLDSFLTNEASIEIGLTPRFLLYKHPQIDFNEPKELLPLSDLFDEFGGGVAAKYYNRMKALLQRDRGVNVQLSPEAKELIIRSSTEYYLRLGDRSPYYTTNRIVSVFTTRMAELVSRIACILYLYENDGNVLPVSYVERARVIIEYYYESLKSLVGNKHSYDMYDKFLDSLYESRKRTGNELTISQIQQAKLIRDSAEPNRRMKTSEIIEILTILEDNGLVKLYPARAGGRSKIVRLHPEWR